MVLVWGEAPAGSGTGPMLAPSTCRIAPSSIRQGDLGSTINTTGTIEPEEVVDVGAQVAGRIESFGADPRDPSKTDQLRLARRAGHGAGPARQCAVPGASRPGARPRRQGRGRHRASPGQAPAGRRASWSGVSKLRPREGDRRGPGIRRRPWRTTSRPRQRWPSVESALAVARADLEEATVNLGYTTIRSPVKGIILDRRINIGQIVVASLNAPSLFLIAKDLSRLEIWSSVNETDIGSIHEGQEVRFTVSSVPRETFEGKVSQIRLNASMTQNVVTYTVVVAVDNSGGRLLPYLTARLQFEVETRKGVLLVPNAALRWQPLVAGCRPRGTREMRSA